MLEEENTYHTIQKLVVLISVTEPVRQSTPLENNSFYVPALLRNLQIPRNSRSWLIPGSIREFPNANAGGRVRDSIRTQQNEFTDRRHLVRLFASWLSITSANAGTIQVYITPVCAFRCMQSKCYVGKQGRDRHNKSYISCATEVEDDLCSQVARRHLFPTASN